MNKYQEAIASLFKKLVWTKHAEEMTKNEFEVLQELVDKATPIKLIQKIDSSHGEIVNLCPICGALNFDDKEYHTCWRCGQAIDWREDE